MNTWEENMIEIQRLIETQRALEEGYAVGYTKGASEKAMKIAMKLKEKGMPTNEIAEVTGLNIEEIEDSCM